ncbi:MAG: ATP-dependent DNA helicase RecQ, partial [Bacteroidetes bacterium]|nr:ATP-dependent DNA helicase RecQ [Bacteroidota bacterium]
PLTNEELGQVNGVGKGKVMKFGKLFLEVINKYVEDNDITTASDVVVKSAINKSKIKIFIIQQIDRKIDLDEIAESKAVTLNNIIDEIEHICYSGTKLNLDYYIHQILDEEKQEEIYDYFMNSETDSIDTAFQELGEEDYTEEEIRLMRIKFLSEIAN